MVSALVNTSSLPALAPLSNCRHASLLDIGEAAVVFEHLEQVELRLGVVTRLVVLAGGLKVLLDFRFHRFAPSEYA